LDSRGETVGERPIYLPADQGTLVGGNGREYGCQADHDCRDQLHSIPMCRVGAGDFRPCGFVGIQTCEQPGRNAALRRGSRQLDDAVVG
jgi:hypothetical protein